MSPTYPSAYCHLLSIYIKLAHWGIENKRFWKGKRCNLQLTRLGARTLSITIINWDTQQNNVTNICLLIVVSKSFVLNVVRLSVVAPYNVQVRSIVIAYSKTNSNNHAFMIVKWTFTWNIHYYRYSTMKATRHSTQKARSITLNISLYSSKW